MNLNLRLDADRDADLIRHLSRLRDGALSDEARRLMRAGLGTGGARGSPRAEPGPEREPEPAELDAGAEKPAAKAGGADLSDIERAIIDAAWE